MMNLKLFGKTWSWPNWGIIKAFVWRDWGKSGKTSGGIVKGDNGNHRQ
jgi:hypothetical protein